MTTPGRVKLTFPFIILVLVTSLTPTTLGAAELSRLAGQIPDSGEYHLQLFNHGEPDGFMRLGWYKRGTSLHVYDRSNLPSMELYESMHLVMDAEDLQPETATVRFHKGSAIMHINVRGNGESITGERVIERPGIENNVHKIDQAVPADVIFRALAFILPLVMNPEPGQAMTYDWYSPIADAVQKVTLQSFEGEVVETPAGTFETVRWELRGGSPENDIYLSRGDNPRIVRIDVLGQDMKFLASAGTTP